MTPNPTSPPAAAVESVGRYIGRFTVLRVLGAGSEGVVYLANDPKLGREVAIKTQTLGRSPDPVLADLLITTACTASKLSHPNIVPVFEAGLHEGTPYVVYEYVAGRTLATMLAEDGPLAPARAVVMMSQILAGVALIHERSLIHGDIKPANILVGGDGRARVADFGLLREARADDVDHTSGTLRYMSPECLNGGTPDCRRDVYALGLVFHEMLSGEPVIGPEGDRRAQAHRIQFEPVALPSARNPRVPQTLDAIVLKALEKAPHNRFANAGEMKRELDRIRVPADARQSIELRETATHSTVEFLLRRMAHKSDFGALSNSIAGINKLAAAGDDASLKQLSDMVMRDFALTQKLLRVVNAAASGAGKVTRVSDAISILGLARLRSLAIAMALAGGAGGVKSQPVAAALTDAFIAGVVARNVGRAHRLPAVEELFICGMFIALGELLTLYYLPEEHAEIMRRVIDEDSQAIAAARAVIGISFGDLGTAVARHWQFPPAMVNALAPLPEEALPPMADTDARTWYCVGYARELCALARISNPDTREAAFAAHVERFATTIRVLPQAVRDLMGHSLDLARSYATAAGLAVSDTPMLAGMRALSGAPQAEAPAPLAETPAAAAPPPAAAPVVKATPAPPAVAVTPAAAVAAAAPRAQPRSGFGARLTQALRGWL